MKIQIKSYSFKSIFILEKILNIINNLKNNYYLEEYL